MMIFLRMLWAVGDNANALRLQKEFKVLKLAVERVGLHNVNMGQKMDTCMLEATVLHGEVVACNTLATKLQESAWESNKHENKSNYIGADKRIEILNTL